MAIGWGAASRWDAMCRRVVWIAYLWTLGRAMGGRSISSTEKHGKDEGQYGPGEKKENLGTVALVDLTGISSLS